MGPIAMNPEAQVDQASVLNMQDLLDRCLGNLEFVERILGKFLSRFDTDLAEIEQALESEDVEAVARVAHRLKGASATAAATGIRDCAAEIEELARGRLISKIPERVRSLRSEGARFAESASSLGIPAGSHA
jgi:HPt (histidine-containing phosphotransfer) domain-containing protein